MRNCMHDLDTSLPQQGELTFLIAEAKEQIKIKQNFFGWLRQKKSQESHGSPPPSASTDAPRQGKRIQGRHAPAATLPRAPTRYSLAVRG